MRTFEVTLHLTCESHEKLLTILENNLWDTQEAETEELYVANVRFMSKREVRRWRSEQMRLWREERNALIKRRHWWGWSVTTIARNYHVSESTVRRVLKES